MYAVTKCRQGFFAFLLIAIVAVGCKKDRISPNPNPPAPTPVVQEITVVFSAETIPFQHVDSAVVMIRDTNQNVKKVIRLQNCAASLYESLADLPAGDYTAELMVQTKKEVDNTARQFVLKKTFSLPLQANLQVKAPTGNFETDNWFRRAVLTAPGEEVVAIVAMDPRDAFYEIRMKEAQWASVTLQRSSVYGQWLVARKEHVKSLQGVIVFADYTSFDSYVQKMYGNWWTKAKISISIKHQSGREIFLDYEYNQ